MELIKKLSTRFINGRLESWAVFFCLFCKQEIERPLGNGLKAKSCGCQQYSSESRNKLIANSLIGKKRSKEIVEKIRISNTGKKRSEEFKQNMSKIHKGKIISKELRGILSQKNKGKKRTIEQRQRYSEAFIGKPKSEEHRQNLSKSQKGKRIGKNNHLYGVQRFGEQNPNWQGGKSFEIYPQEFKRIKKFIYERDNYKCQFPECTEIHDRLHVHHIDYDKQNNNPENLITLGTSCHSKTNGKKKRLYYTEYYQNIMINRIVECLL